MDLRVSRHLDRGLLFDRELEQSNLSRTFKFLDKTLMQFDFSSPNEYSNLDNRAVSIGIDGSLELHSIDGNQFASFNFVNTKEVGPMAIELDINSTQDTDISFSYAIKSDTMSHPGRLQETRAIKQGRHKIYLRILHPEAIGQLQLTPMSPGKYQIYSLTIKKL